MSTTMQPMKPNATSTRARTRDEEILLLTVAGKSTATIASITGRSRTTVWRITSSHEFQEKLQAARSEIFQSAMNQLHAHAGDFVATLASVATDPKINPAARANAAGKGLDALMALKNDLDFDQRLAAFERVERERANQR